MDRWQEYKHRYLRLSSGASDYFPSGLAGGVAHTRYAGMRKYVIPLAVVLAVAAVLAFVRF